MYEVGGLIQLATRAVMTLRFKSDMVTVVLLRDVKDFYKVKNLCIYDTDKMNVHLGLIAELSGKIIMAWHSKQRTVQSMSIVQ